MVLGITPNTKFVYSLTTRYAGGYLLKKNKFKNENLWYNEELFGSYADTIISAGMAKNIIRENDYEKDTYRSYSHNYLLYGSCIIYLREI